MKVKGKLEKKKTNEKNRDITNTIILGLVGLLLLLIPSTLNNILGIIVGLAILLSGIINLGIYFRSSFQSSLITGILYSLLGIIILISPGSVIRAVAIGGGLVLLIQGLIKIKLALTLNRLNNKWIGSLVIGCLISIFGLILIFNPFSGVAVTKLVGLFLTIVAIFDIIDEYFLK